MNTTALFYLNGRQLQQNGPALFAPLSTFLRDELRLTGTKVVCAEGACGACTVLVGRPQYGGLRYRAMNACLLPLYQIAGCHVVTVEGVTGTDALSPVQDAMVAGHGAQCGFCTPGMVMTLTGFCEACRPVSELPDALCGNLCRCTGYLSILESARSIDRDAYQSLAVRYPEADIANDLFQYRRTPLLVETDAGRVFLPTNLEEAARWKQTHPDATVVAGGTELGVQWQGAGQAATDVLSLAWLPSTVRCEQDALVMDAAASWAQVEEAARLCFPEFARLLTRFAGPQIKNAGTVGGQIVQNSPIGDALPVLSVLNASVQVVGTDGRRSVPAAQFLENVAAVLAPDELVSRIVLSLPHAGQILRLEKVSRRSGFDQSVVSAALLVTLDGGRIADASLAFGGIGPRVQRTPQTEAFLVGRPFSEVTLCDAGDVLRGEIAPADDVRGGAEYRSLLAANLLLRLLDDPEEAA